MFSKSYWTVSATLIPKWDKMDDMLPTSFLNTVVKILNKIVVLLKNHTSIPRDFILTYHTPKLLVWFTSPPRIFKNAWFSASLSIFGVGRMALPFLFDVFLPGVRYTHCVINILNFVLVSNKNSFRVSQISPRQHYEINFIFGASGLSLVLPFPLEWAGGQPCPPQQFSRKPAKPQYTIPAQALWQPKAHVSMSPVPLSQII